MSRFNEAPDMLGVDAVTEALGEGAWEGQASEPLRAAPGCCEEASPLSHDFYIPCNAPATCHVAFVRSGEGPYRMCSPCGAHNTSNRGASYVAAEWKAARNG